MTAESGDSAWVARSDVRPFASVRVRSHERRCVLVFEPVGSEYVMEAGDEVVVEVVAPSRRPEDTDIEIIHGRERIEIWTEDWRAWNKAGRKIP